MILQDFAFRDTKNCARIDKRRSGMGGIDGRGYSDREETECSGGVKAWPEFKVGGRRIPAGFKGNTMAKPLPHLMEKAI